MKRSISFLQFLLIPLGCLYGLIQFVRRYLYQLGVLKSIRLPGKVISVGNLEVGGTGKSPITIAIAKAIIAQGGTPAIVTRGYRSGMGANESCVLINGKMLLPPKDTQSFFADEARMQSALLPDTPIIIGRDRVGSCRRYLEKNSAPSHWLLDDGFQHLKIERDLNIALLDAKYPLDNGLVLPAGRLREFPNTLNQASILVLTRANPEGFKLPKSLQKFNSLTYFSRFNIRDPTIVRPVGKEKVFDKNWKTLLLCGIAKPADLIKSVKDKGIKVNQTLIVRDHQPFLLRDIKEKINSCDAIITTEKDYFRDTSIFSELEIPVATLPLTADISEFQHIL